MDVARSEGSGGADPSMTSVLFRADASLEIGTGHVMRCLALAEALGRHGVTSRFICRDHAGHLAQRIRRAGYRVDLLPLVAGQPLQASDIAGDEPAHAAWLGTDWQTDASQTVAMMTEERPDWLVIDHYALDRRWEQALRPFCGRIMAIDDLADRAHDVDLLLDQNLGRKAGDYAGLLPRTAAVLAGAGHALLRPEFSASRETSLKRRLDAGLQRLLVSLGGVDKDNVTGQVLAALAQCDLPPGCRISVVMGEQAPWLDAVRRQVAAMPAADLQVGVSDVAALMADCDLAIGAAGTSAWERCCMGLPTLLVVLAENQVPGARALAAAGAALLLGEGDELLPSLKASITKMTDPVQLRRMQTACANVTDGRGTERLVEVLLAAA